MLLIFAVVPIDEKNKWGRRLARFDFYSVVILSIQMFVSVLRNWPISGTYVSMLVATFQCISMWRTLKHSIPIKPTVSSPIKREQKEKSFFLVLYYSGDQAITVFFLKFVMLLYSDLFSVTLYVIVLGNYN